MIAIGLEATLTLLTAFLLLRLARRASASLRHLVATASFGVLLFLPLAAALMPPRIVTIPARTLALPPAAIVPAAPAAPITAAAPTAAAPQPATRINLAQLIYAVYFAGAALLLLSLLRGIARLAGMRARAEVSVEGTRMANALARSLGMHGGIEVALSDETAVPVTFGWSRPVILLPVWSGTDTLVCADLERALRHEVEHIVRRDWPTQLISRLALAIYWPHPFVWALWSRLRLEAERACDDAVIRSSAAEPYADQLVALARRLTGRSAVPALSMATRSHLGQRVDALLDQGQRRAPLTRFGTLTVTAAAIAVILTLAPFRLMSAPLISDTASDPVADRADRDDDDDEIGGALLHAAERGDVAAIRRLIAAGAKAETVIRGDGSPLIAAARRGKLEAMKELIAAGANVNTGVTGDGNALTMAAQHGHLEAVRYLLDHGAEIDRGVEGDGNALIMAAGHGKVEVVQLLLDRGANIEAVVPGDENPLIHASEGGQSSAVRLLLARGANPNARVWAELNDHDVRTGEWRTPLGMARRNGHQEVVTILRAAGARE
jgi:beta-lactamase regulating signal transducer with metallopeptidase domain